MKGQENKWPSNFSTATLDARRQWNSAVRVLKGNDFYLELESLISRPSVRVEVKTFFRHTRKVSTNLPPVYLFSGSY